MKGNEEGLRAMVKTMTGLRITLILATACSGASIIFWLLRGDWPGVQLGGLTTMIGLAILISDTILFIGSKIKGPERSKPGETQN